MPNVANIVSLDAFRKTLAERFPEALPPPERRWSTGWPAVDSSGGGLKHHAITELCSPVACGSLFLEQIFASAHRQGSLVGLVDVGRSFDPGSYDPALLRRVLAIFCETPEQSVKATDLLLRDGNLPLVLLDLHGKSARTIPANTWHRFQRLVEKSGTALVVLTPQPTVEAARIRIALRAHWRLAALKQSRPDLLAEVDVRTYFRGRSVTPQEEPHARFA